MITGEHGTGKEIVAHTLHALSARADQPWIAVQYRRTFRGRIRKANSSATSQGAFTDAPSRSHWPALNSPTRNLIPG